MPLATKNGAIIVKDGKLAESCGCCASDPCFKKYSSIIVSATASDFFRSTSYSPPDHPASGRTEVTHNHLFFPGSQYVGEIELSLSVNETSSMFFGAGILITTRQQWSYEYPTSSLICPVVNSSGQVVVRPKITIGKTFSQLHVFGIPVQNISVTLLFRADFVVLRDCGTVQKTAADVNCNGGGGNEIYKLEEVIQFFTPCQNTSALGFATPIQSSVPLIDNFQESRCQQVGGPFLSQEESGSLSYSLSVLQWIV